MTSLLFLACVLPPSPTADAAEPAAPADGAAPRLAAPPPLAGEDCSCFDKEMIADYLGDEPFHCAWYVGEGYEWWWSEARLWPGKARTPTALEEGTLRGAIVGASPYADEYYGDQYCSFYLAEYDGAGSWETLHRYHQAWSWYSYDGNAEACIEDILEYAADNGVDCIEIHLD